MKKREIQGKKGGGGGGLGPPLNPPMAMFAYILAKLGPTGWKNSIRQLSSGQSLLLLPLLLLLLRAGINYP